MLQRMSRWVMKRALSVVSFIIAYLPRKVIWRLGGLLGWVLHHLWHSRRAIVVQNIALCFPDMPLRHQANMERAVFASLACGLLEAMVAWQGQADRLLADVEVYGEQHLEQALQTGKGVMLLSPHFSALELLGYWVSWRMKEEKANSGGVYFAQKNKGFDHWVTKRRLRYYHDCTMLEDSALRSMIRFLKAANVLVMYPDLDRGLNRSIFVDFFGISAATMPLVPKMVRLTEAQVLPISMVRSNGRYRIDIMPPMNDLLVGDDALDTRMMNRLFEQRISEYPEQYYWLHRRFKTRPQGEPSLYD